MTLFINLKRIGYICLGICLFILIPAYFFAIIEQWSYLGKFSFCSYSLLIGPFSDAIYFSIISLTKVGFGDYVPRTHPPDRYADYIHDNHKCLKGSIATLK